MRLYLRLTKNKQIIPFNYQPYLTGALHKWIGDSNDIHDRLSLYSFSWLQNVDVISGKGIMLKKDSYFFISAHDVLLIKKILKGIIADSDVCFGANVFDVQIVENPSFSTKERFLVASPVFVKRRFDNNIKHIVFSDPNSKNYLTETLQKKLAFAGLNTEAIKVEFDTSCSFLRVKLIRYKEVNNRVNICPVIIEGTPEQIAFAWNVGVGNSTGIGFGALK